VKRPLRPEEHFLWAKVAASIRPAPGREVPVAGAVEPPVPKLAAQPGGPAPAPKPTHRPHHHPHHHRIGAPDEIEPRRLRRLTRERESLGPRIDLHGLSQDQAQAALEGFLIRASADGWRSVLVITGKGLLGDGVLRRRLPDWLARPQVRALVSGVAEAHRRHGGKGALYLTLRAPASR
jgi:DNA-nicking Smr family endonuclease